MSKALSFLEAEICNESLFHFRRKTLYDRGSIEIQEAATKEAMTEAERKGSLYGKRRFKLQ